MGACERSEYCSGYRSHETCWFLFTLKYILSISWFRNWKTLFMPFRIVWKMLNCDGWIIFCYMKNIHKHNNRYLLQIPYLNENAVTQRWVVITKVLEFSDKIPDQETWKNSSEIFVARIVSNYFYCS